MKTRIKKSIVPVINTREEADQSVDCVARLANLRRALAAELDAELISAKQRFGAEIAELDQQIEQQRAGLEVWAGANPDLFTKKKSLDFLNGTIGFRTGTPKLSLLSRAWNWDSVTSAVIQRMPRFIRSKPEVDKEQIIAQRDELEEFLPSCGLKITQGESFYVEPNLTDDKPVLKAA